MKERSCLLRDHIEKIVRLTDEEWESIFAYFTFGAYDKNHSIFAEGDKVQHVYFIVAGLVKLVYVDADAKSHIVSFAMEDWWETDFQAYYTQSKATFSLRCIERTEVFSLSLKHFELLCSSFQKMQYFFLRKTMAGHISSQQRILSFLTSGAKERYDLLLSEHASLVQRVPKTYLASYLGVSRETLSRLIY